MSRYTQLCFCRPASSRLSRASETSALSLAWAIIRLRHPILASICLIDSYGASSFAYDLPKDIDAAVADAEGSTELKHFGHASGMRPSEELEDAYKSGICKVSRSHLSHLLVSTSHGSGSPGVQSISPPSTPSSGSPPRLFSSANQSPAMTEYNLLLCTPHYVSTPMALSSILSELAALLSDPSATEYTLRQTLAKELNAKTLARQQRTSPLKSATYSPSPALPEFKIRMPTEVRGRRPALPVAATTQPQRA
ncbi:hypothetical protein SISSUDRAFT_151902 [Sistotremastrum suecicum HHB10207 ss-3]|uniref:Uncharacterized protein n=1 Tax=Sistotremastrum suecicum HHB10207 ss-3 TaxID=1314776 RepID=A0A166AS78_9AGAM|nr:hypothetical protein SISSUDRAFT_151902 [Sistotremastrum suecicum HHB10207 ss-3]